MITLMYQLILLSVAVELIASLSSRFMRVLSTPLAGLSIIMTSFSATGYAAFTLSWAPVLIAAVAAVRVFSIGRVIKHRLHKKDLQKKTTVSSVVFGSITAGLVWVSVSDVGYQALLGLQVVQLTAAALLLTSIIISLYKYSSDVCAGAAGDLPTISVCIPARNETAGLPECIQSVLDSTYPKLEILVLDDCSHDKTPYVIKSFAHAGVRFIKGLTPTDAWLPKNSAYQRLAEEAKGDILVFMGVDVNLQQDSLNSLPMLLSGRDMVSVMPVRSAAARASIAIQPLRYWWELALWRFGLLDPPTLSTFWAVNASSMRKISNFTGLKKAASPEAVLAKKFNSMQGYAFIIGKKLGVTSSKTPKEQYATSIRTRYIQLGKSLELSLLVILTELTLAVLPIVVIASSVAAGSELPIYQIALTSVMAAGNGLVYRLVLGKAWIIGLFTAPMLAIADSFLIFRSMYGYEYGKITWKDRNVCLPLLQPEKSLPELTVSED